MVLDHRARKSTRSLPNASSIEVLIVSEKRFVREALVELLPRYGPLSVSGLAADRREVMLGIADDVPDIILLDESLPDGRETVRQIRDVAPDIAIIVIGVAETVEAIVAWAEAGISGYIPNSVGILDLVSLMVDILRGAQPCSANVSAGLLRRLSQIRAGNGAHHTTTAPPRLTARELQIAEMIVEGKSNKEIARHLNIEVSTAKTHVHHILRKLGLNHRCQTARSIHVHRESF